MENQVEGWFYWGFIEGSFISPCKLNVPNYQYTGLKDCKGKEIYEGDLVEDNSGARYVQGLCGKEKQIRKPLTASNIYRWEKVIGNIYEGEIGKGGK